MSRRPVENLSEAMALEREGRRHIGMAEALTRKHVATLVSVGEIDTSKPGRIDLSLPPDAITHLRTARELYLQALARIPSDRFSDRAVLHHQLGEIGKNLAIPDSLFHLGEAVRLHEAMRDRFRAGQSRETLAEALIHRGERYAEAAPHAKAALAHFLACGARAQDESARARRLVAEIEARISPLRQSGY